MSELKPCPFCGSHNVKMFYDERQNYHVECYGCNKTVSFHIVKESSWREAVDIWNRRAQPANEPCADCTGIMYRQTASGKIIPADRKCAVMEPPTCYQPDGDGCAYQIYGDNNDEPIDRCKACPLCYSDKVRHRQPANEPLTKISEMLEQAAQDMDDKCRQWQCVLQRVHGAGTFDQNSGLWVGIDKEREAKAQARFEAYRYALEVIDKIAEHVSNPYKSDHKPGGEQDA